LGHFGVRAKKKCGMALRYLQGGRREGGKSPAAEANDLKMEAFRGRAKDGLKGKYISHQRRKKKNACFAIAIGASAFPQRKRGLKLKSGGEGVQRKERLGLD